MRLGENMNKLSIIIPSYNEEDRIVTTLEQTLSYLGGQAYESEVIVVSDGSTDRTGEVVRGFVPPENVSLRFTEYHPNRGKGYAVRWGMLRGAGDRLLFMDADFSVPIQELEKGLRLIDDGADAAIGSRAVSGSVVTRHQNFFRELSAKFYTFIQNRFLGFTYKDTQCGFKIFSAETARVLFEKQKLDSVIFDPEILWLAKTAGFKVVEFPVQWRHVGDSRIQYDSIKKSLFVFQELFKIRKLHRAPKILKEP
jgi:dolichyl-phosphate beta-glucosyltransferase